MHLKSLTMKGFKSFASSTTLRLEPGITAVVGPNGSGKSNVVDAIAWVLGEQGAKALRGGKMEDVIFAGTADRPPLGRAEVTLTIDNSDGALPIDYAEVSITRRMFRDGVGEYEINGSSCRLLDIQELLSDSGIGREMHVIVGQGQLDAVLQARPEDRRAFVEEAAGVLKHRKRREKTIRKLDAMQANLNRLTDLTAEIRRQLGPLGRQAAVARRAAGVQADLRDARMRLLADELTQILTKIEQDAVDEQTAVEHRNRVQRDLAEATERLSTAEAELRELSPAVARAQETWFALSALAERVRGTVALAAERARNLSAPVRDAAESRRDPDELEARAERAEAEHEALVEAVEAAAERLAAASDERQEREHALRAAEHELSAASRLIADRREGLAKLAGQVQAARSRLSAGSDEVQRLSAAVTEARDRAAQAQVEFTRAQDTVGDLDSSEVGLDEAHEMATAELEVARTAAAELTDHLRHAQSTASSLQARVDALALGLDRRDGTADLLAAGADAPGLLGGVADAIGVTPGHETAIAAALGAVADAVAVRSVSDAAAALDLLRSNDSGRAGILIQGARSQPDRRSWPELPAGAHWAVDLIRAPDMLLPALTRTLELVAVVPDAAAAIALIGAVPDVRCVTADGDVIGPDWASGGSAGGQTLLEIQATRDQAADELTAAQARIEELTAALAQAKARVSAAEAAAAATLSALNESDAHISAVAEELARYGSAARAAAAEANRLEERRQAAETAREQHRRAVDDLEARLAAVESEQAPVEVDTSLRDELADSAAQARQREVEARLVHRSAEERANAAAGAGDSLRRAAAAERDQRRRIAAANQRRVLQAAVATRVAELGERVAQRLSVSLAEAAAEKDTCAQRRAEVDAVLHEARARAAELQSQWDKLTDAVHSGEVLRAQQTMLAQQLADRSVDEFAIPADELIAAYGPSNPVPPNPQEMAEYEAAKERGEDVAAPPSMPYDRPTQERRLRRAERDLTALGKVNPLALEEYAGLEERHKFLATQLEDLKSTRKDLLQVIKDVDEKILELFAAAYWDVEREFKIVFSTLFPGGEGELVLTDPSNMLTTGIEVNARPPGKKVKRLSLLSGGERSLTAVALLVAIFRARPSPFYVMDEVEAALDEVNLTRLVSLMAELRESSQLIVITHQKFTMESADALYGVSMRGDGISQVISQRIRERPAAEPTSPPVGGPAEELATAP
ncbi:chromosome segregation protein SMC [Nakamurella multipartita]|uniref:Chromosome partition protein Smc n=1 Tax=Nakamurella multipartita (strain ATCC 700099 / DSM 44233 / CIP 104796 / JCM 9543 / NBRC 105858 / Y-104) TaxID=479431 RepID=C8XH72_NAKMY|nr:chromosome segregation protein SMC [Nakamurella multipartita]ACV78278.1 chromosome segregation protein SMC [Nakamurella multipartita DSM 44233]